MSDPFANSVNSLGAPAADCFSITPADNVDLTTFTKALYVGTGGDVVVRAINSDSYVTFKNVIGGSILDIRVKSINATGTTALDLVGLV